MNVRRLSFGLSRQVWIVEIGVFLNMLGYGAVLPFEIIYLHDGRGFELGVAGLVVGLVTGIAVVTSPVAGAAIDRIGAGRPPLPEGCRLRPATAAWRLPSRRRLHSPPPPSPGSATAPSLPASPRS